MSSLTPASTLEKQTATDHNGCVWDMERVACLLCGDTGSTVAHTWVCPYPAIPMEFAIAACDGCGFKYTNPRLSREALADYYASQNPYSGEEYHAVDEVRGRYDEFLDSLAEAGVRQGRMLEIGCDKGQLLKIARERGFEVEGLEPSASARIAREQFGLDVKQGMFDSQPYEDDSFDAVVLLDVLEHISDPLQSLQKVHRILKPGGLVLVKVPNVRREYGLYPRIRGGALGFGAHEHLSHFSQATLADAYQRAGLEVAAWRGFLPLDVQGGAARIVWGMVSWLGGIVGRVWKSWPDHHVALVCIGKKPLGS